MVHVKPNEHFVVCALSVRLEPAQIDPYNLRFELVIR